MSKARANLIAELVGDAYRYVPAPPTCTVPDSKVSVLAAALDVFSRNSKYRTDAVDIIKGWYPNYFRNE